MRHVALISEHASPLAALGGVDAGGQNVYVGQIARHLAARGWRVDVLTRRDDPAPPESVPLCDGARVVHVTAGPAAFVHKEDLLPFMPAFTEGVLDLSRRPRRPYDLLHANFFMSGLVAANVKAALGTPYAVTFHALGRVRRIHQGSADGFPDERFAIESRVAAEADVVFAECPQDEDDLVRLYGVPPEKVRIVPCGFDPEEFGPKPRAEAREALRLDPEEPLVLQLGRMVPRKGVEDAVRGFARLVRDRGILARLLVVGGDSASADARLTPEIGRLRHVAEEEGVAERVTFTGSRPRSELRDYYAAADVFVTTPWYEPFGITPVEAMACGTPVVGSAVGGVKYTVVDGETGYLVPPHDPEGLADRLERLLTDRPLRELLGRQAVTRAKRHFTWAGIAEDVAAHYTDVLAAYAPDADTESGELAAIDAAWEDAVETLRRSGPLLRGFVAEAARELEECFARGGHVLVAGNGGSASDAQHLAAELVGRYLDRDRDGLPCVALTADSAVLTAWSNDVGFDDVFARQVSAHGRPGDVLVGITTSGNSPNLTRAFDAARERGMRTVGLLGDDGGELRSRCDVAVTVPARETPRVQEVHALVLHVLAGLVEDGLASARQRAAPGDAEPHTADSAHERIKEGEAACRT